MPFHPFRPTVSRSPARFALSILGLAAALWIPSAVTAQDNAPPELLRAPTADSADEAPGWRVFLDPVTGEITSRPSAEQLRRFQEFLDEREALGIGEPVTEELHPFVLYGGGTGVYVGDRFMTSTVVRRAPDGSLVIDCATDPEHVLHQHPAERSGAPVK